MEHKFVYSSYWHTWSRVLKRDGIHFVEVNLTPIGPWERDVEPIVIRRHSTSRRSNDMEVSILPDHVRSNMVDKIGEELTHRLLTEDFYSQIDWNLFKKYNNGGAELSSIISVGRRLELLGKYEIGTLAAEDALPSHRELYRDPQAALVDAGWTVIGRWAIHAEQDLIAELGATGGDESLVVDTIRVYEHRIRQVAHIYLPYDPLPGSTL